MTDNTMIKKGLGQWCLTQSSTIFHYRIKRFFSGVHACVNDADAITK